MKTTSSYKTLYNELTLEYFKDKGWSAFIVDKPDAQLPNVIATKDNTIAVIEIKNPKEQSCSLTVDDSKGIIDGINPKIVNYLKTARQNIAKLFSEEDQKLARFYAITIMCQLLKHFYESEFKLKLHYPKKFKKSKNYTIQPYLIIPIDKSAQANIALDYLTKNHYLVGYSVERDSKVYIIKIKYNTKKLSES